MFKGNVKVRDRASVSIKVSVKPVRVRRRAIRIIYSYTCDMPYINAVYIADIPSLVDRREQLSCVFFKLILQPSSCLFHTLPPARDLATVTRLIAASKFPRIPTCTKKYQSFISFALSRYQAT